MVTASDEITIRLPRNDVGQILDALCIRRDEWRYTQRYLEEGYEEAGRVIEECKDADEARSIADYYDQIIATIRRQLK
jgi:hypothetical protein